MQPCAGKKKAEEKRKGVLRMAKVSMKALLESGVHFGHRTHRWNPKMNEYIFTERNGIHIIDLQQTVKSLNKAVKMVTKLVANGGTVLFVGTKRQAYETIVDEANRCSMPYVTVRWLGGMLTNWTTMRQRINELDRLERMRDNGEFDLLTKKEGLMLTRKIDKLEARFGGIRKMHKLPDLVYIIDVRREITAVKEANTLNIPILALVDTNCDPRDIDHVIPSNDDAIRAIKLMVGTIADAVLEGKGMRKDEEAQEDVAKAEDVKVEELSDDDLLGEATLAKVEAAQAEEIVAATEEAEKAEKAATEEAVTEEAVTEEAVTEEVITEEVVTEEEKTEETSDEESSDEEKAEK